MALVGTEVGTEQAHTYTALKLPVLQYSARQLYAQVQHLCGSIDESQVAHCIVQRAFPHPGGAPILACQLMILAPHLPILQLESHSAVDQVVHTLLQLQQMVRAFAM